MIKTPVSIVWNLISDVMSAVFSDNERRPIEASWHAMNMIASDLSEYMRDYQRTNNILSMKPYAAWGTYQFQPQKIESFDVVEGLILGGRSYVDNWRNVIFTYDESEVISGNGFLNFLNSSQDYDFVSVYNLMSGGRVLIVGGLGFTKQTYWQPQDNASYVFTEDDTFDGTQRWISRGSEMPQAQNSGVLLRPRDVNWAILSDRFYIDGISKWRQVWRGKVNRWDQTKIHRSISVVSNGDYGSNFEVRLFDDGTEVRVASGVSAFTKYESVVMSGNTITRTNGNFKFDGFTVGMDIEVSGTLYDGTYTIQDVTQKVITLESATFAPSLEVNATLKSVLTPHAGDTDLWRSKLINGARDIEFVVTYDTLTSTIYSEVWLDGEVARQTKPFKVSPGRRKNIFDVFNQRGTVEVVISEVITDGKLWDRTSEVDLSAEIGGTRLFVYEVEEPVVGGNDLRIEPWNISPEADVINWDSANQTIELGIIEDYNEYLPEFVRITDEFGNWVMAQRIDDE